MTNASADPLILTCGGVSSDAARAEAVADALADAGLGVRADLPVEGALLIAVDGCSGACCSQRIDAQGLEAAAVIDAAAARDTRTALARARAQLDQRRPRRHRLRQTPPAPADGAHAPHTARDYLLALDELTAPLVECGVIAPGLPTLASHVSRLLGVSRPSAGEMLERLEHDGLVARTDGRQVVLTAAGRRAADAAVRRHRILEVFAVDVLGYGAAESFDVARGFDAAFDDEAVERLMAALDLPDRCPHGWPIEPERARAMARQLQTLDAVERDDTPTVIATTERAADPLRELAAAQIRPGARPAARVHEQLSPAARRSAFVRSCL